MKKYYVRTATIDITLTHKQWVKLMEVVKKSGEWEKIEEKPITFSYKEKEYFIEFIEEE